MTRLAFSGYGEAHQTWAGYDIEPPPPPENKPYRLNPADFPNGKFAIFTAENYRSWYGPANTGYNWYWDPTFGDEGGCYMEMPSGATGNPGSVTVRNCFPRDQDTVGFAMQCMFNQAFIKGGGDVGNGGGTSASPKIVILHEGTASCQTHEYTPRNRYYGGYWAWYTRCGSGKIEEVKGSNYNYQPGGETAAWRNDPPGMANAMMFEAMVPCTYVHEFTRLRSSSPRAEAWVWMEGGSEKWRDRWVKVLDHTMSSRNSVKWINSFHLANYCTSKKSGIPHDPFRTWYQNCVLTPGPIRDVYGVEQ